MEGKRETSEKRMQDFDVPKIIKYLSLLYICLSILVGVFSLFSDILEQGKATLNQFTSVIYILKNVISGFLF